MANSAGITRTIVSMYRNHFGLFCRILLPVLILAILVDIALFFRTAEELPAEFKVGWNVNTVDGIGTLDISQREPGFDARFGFFPSVRLTREDGSTWIWSLDLRNFRNVNYYSLLLLVLCPLSLAVAQLYGGQKITAREVWRHTGRSIWKVLGTNLLLVLILDGLTIFFSFALRWFIPWAVFKSMFTITVAHTYFLVYVSLYNPCLMLEQHSVLSVFRRSYALVKGNWWRFFLIYLVTSWVASTLTSVLLGCALLTFSVFTPELSSIREILFPFNFFTLFLGANVDVSLANLPGVPTTVAILAARGLILACLVPIWAIVPTRLYLERATEEAC